MALLWGFSVPLRTVANNNNTSGRLKKKKDRHVSSIFVTLFCFFYIPFLYMTPVAFSSFLQNKSLEKSFSFDRKVFLGEGNLITRGSAFHFSRTIDILYVIDPYRRRMSCFFSC